MQETIKKDPTVKLDDDKAKKTQSNTYFLAKLVCLTEQNAFFCFVSELCG